MRARLVSTLPSMNLMTARRTQIKPLTMDTLNKNPSWEEPTAQRAQQSQVSRIFVFFFPLAPPTSDHQFRFFLRSSRILLLLRTAAKGTKYKSITDCWRIWREREREKARALQSSGSSAAALILHYGPGATKIYSKTKMLERKKSSWLSAPVRLWLSRENEI